MAGLWPFGADSTPKIRLDTEHLHKTFESFASYHKGAFFPKAVIDVLHAIAAIGSLGWFAGIGWDIRFSGGSTNGFLVVGVTRNTGNG
jgi:hypothetical protein